MANQGSASHLHFNEYNRHLEGKTDYDHCRSDTHALFSGHRQRQSNTPNPAVFSTSPQAPSANLSPHFNLTAGGWPSHSSQPYDPAATAGSSYPSQSDSTQSYPPQPAFSTGSWYQSQPQDPAADAWSLRPSQPHDPATDVGSSYPYQSHQSQSPDHAAGTAWSYPSQSYSDPRIWSADQFQLQVPTHAPTPPRKCS
jgi:hypothetical protein